MEKQRAYAVADFLTFLKLGIWKQGSVKDWGVVEQLKINPDGYIQDDRFVKKHPEAYRKQGWFFRKQLGIGLYLLDLQLLYSHVQGYNRICTYMLAISDCRLRGRFRENIHYLKVTNSQALSEFKQVVNGSVSRPERRKLRGPFDRIRQLNRYDSGHLSPHRRY